MKKILIVILFLCFACNVYASECNSGDKTLEIGDNSFCFSLSLLSDDLLTTQNLEDYNITYNNDLINIDLLNNTISNDNYIQMYLYDSNGIDYSVVNGIKSNIGDIFKVVFSYNDTYTFSNEYYIYDSNECFDSYNECNFIAKIKPVVKINANNIEKDTSNNVEVTNKIGDIKTGGNHIFIAILGAVVFLFILIAVVFVLFKNYY